MGMRAAIYLRVSTSRQAEKDLSIPDQRRQIEAYCEARGISVAAEYMEPGRSATDDNRPELQRLVTDARAPEKPFDVVIVHSFSRFFRDAYQFEHYRRMLARRDISILSITQDIGDDPTSGVVRQVLNVFDEYQSKENAKHVLRAMKENARQGFWNGSHPPYGYHTVAVEVRADAVKKHLEIDAPEAEIVAMAFDLCLQGKGIRAIADHFNKRGYRYRRQRRFTSSLVHQILTRTTYTGRHFFNKTACKTRKKKDRSEWIEMATPIIIEPDVFERVQALLKARRPSQTPPRIVNGPTLLTGLLKCSCGAGMTIRTGKGGKYRYYTCNARATQGETACQGHSIPMQKLDDTVMGHLSERIFAPERMKKMLAKLMERNKARLDDAGLEAKQLRTELRKVEEKVDRLYDALADGLTGDTDGFRRTLSRLEQQRDELIRRISGLDRRRDIPKGILASTNVERFTQAVRDKLTTEDPTFRKSYLRKFVERIEFDGEEIRISGPKSALLSGLAETAKPGNHMVPGFDLNWWAHKDSNLGPAD